MQTRNQKNRKLAAIMFTDMVSFSALVQQNEELAYSNRNHFKEVVERITEIYGGRIVQFLGDGTLNIFSSAVEAVRCGIRIQQELIRKTSIPLRIGIHMGEVIMSEDDVFGNTVNIASRIESMATAGSVLISEKVLEEVNNIKEFSVCSLGKFVMKNINEPMELFGLIAEGLVVPCQKSMQGKGMPLMKSIAVLPFLNRSIIPQNEFFCDGLTEEVLNQLAQFDELKVSSRTSSFAYKGKKKDIRKIADELQVNYILEGSIQRIGKEIRITAQLIHAKDGYHLFSISFNRKLNNIFDIQESIAQMIVDRILKEINVVQQETIAEEVSLAHLSTVHETNKRRSVFAVALQYFLSFQFPSFFLFG